MKYFASFLRADGEMEPGGFAMGNNMSYAKQIQRFGFYDGSDENYKEKNKDVEMIFWKGGGHTPKMNCKKAILYILTHEIDVGDEYLVEDISGNISSWTCIRKEQDKIYYGDITYDTQGFKIIGEVSPNATWVRAGDRFNEDQLNFLYKHRSFRDEDFSSTEPYKTSDWKKGEKEKYTCIVEIECPTCKRYH
jgi:hypothetical protein